MKMMTFASSVPSHVYANLHILEQLYCLPLVGAQQYVQSRHLPLWGRGISVVDSIICAIHVVVWAALIYKSIASLTLKDARGE
jgi:hypothetical protein